MKPADLPSGELPTLDPLLGGRIRLYQPAVGYRAAIDPVLLAAAVAPGREARVFDAGCGVGTAALCLLARVPDVRVVGIERDPETAALARRNAALNGVGERFTVIEDDLAALREPTGFPAGFSASFDVVMSNPPYQPREQGRHPLAPGDRAARIESMPLGSWITACTALLKPRGRLVIIQRADRVGDLVRALEEGFGELTVIPLYAHARAQKAGRLIMRARKASRTPATLARGLVLHDDDGGYTTEAQAVLRDALPLDDALARQSSGS